MSRAPIRPLHEKFSWLAAIIEDDVSARFIADSMDAWRGVETCLGLVSSSELTRAHNSWADAGDEERPLLDGVDTERLMRLAMVTARTWDLNCEKHLQRLADRVSKASKKTDADAKGGPQ